MKGRVRQANISFEGQEAGSAGKMQTGLVGSPGRGLRGEASQVSRAASQAPGVGILEIPTGKYFCPSECSDDIINSRHLLCIYLCQTSCFAHNIPVNPQHRKAPIISFKTGKLSLREHGYFARIHG